MLKIRCERLHKTLNYLIRQAELKLGQLHLRPFEINNLNDTVNLLTAVKHLVSSIDAHYADKPLRIGEQSAVGDVVKRFMPFKLDVKKGFLIIDISAIDLILTKLENRFGR